jgi:hypothetical protein
LFWCQDYIHLLECIEKVYLRTGFWYRSYFVLRLVRINWASSDFSNRSSARFSW